jgi:hypothetical protein
VSLAIDGRLKNARVAIGRIAHLSRDTSQIARVASDNSG